MYARLENGVLEYAPVNFKLSDGRIIINFNKDVELMKKHGFKEVIVEEKNFDPTTEQIIIVDYVEQDEKIIILSEIRAKQSRNIQHG